MQPYATIGNVTLYHAAFQDVLPGLHAVAACITDPPYPKQYLSLWGDLAALLPATLERGGSLLSILPHYALPPIVAAISAHLKWRWLVAMVQQEGAHPRMAMGIEVCWKPVGWWVNGAWPQGRGFVRDQCVSVAPSKKHHPWEQNLSWAQAMLKFVPAGGLLLDPMMGAGTLPLAAAAAGYPAIGIDCDESCCEITATRLQALEEEQHARV